MLSSRLNSSVFCAGKGAGKGAARRCSARPSSVRPLAAVREIFMPALSSTMTEGKIVSWLKTEGDKLSKGESVVVVESDKARPTPAMPLRCASQTERHAPRALSG